MHRGMIRKQTMKKNLLILFGSPHKKGYTSLLLEYFLKFLPDFSINYIYAYDEMIKPCIGCNKCKSTYECIFRDMDYINNLLCKSNFIIIASPIYNASFPAPLKSIFDRMQNYYFARKSSKFISENKKKVLLLLTQGSKNIDYTHIILPQINPIVKILGGELIENFILKDTDNNNFDIDKFYIKSKNKVKDIINRLDSNFVG